LAEIEQKVKERRTGKTEAKEKIQNLKYGLVHGDGRRLLSALPHNRYRALTFIFTDASFNVYTFTNSS
jgi:hypothetical protein